MDGTLSHLGSGSMATGRGVAVRGEPTPREACSKRRGLELEIIDEKLEERNPSKSTLVWTHNFKLPKFQPIF